MGNYRDQLYVKKIKAETLGTDTGYAQTGRFRMEVNIPGIRGELSAARIGQQYCGEMIDLCRHFWSRGITLQGDHERSEPPSSMKIARKRYREKKYKFEQLIEWQAKAIRNQKWTVEEYKKQRTRLRASRRKAVRALNKTKGGRARWNIKKRIARLDEKIDFLSQKITDTMGAAKRVAKLYRKRATSAGRSVVTGSITKPRNIRQYIPIETSYNGTYARFNRSGLMIDSLRGRYYAERRSRTADGRLLTTRARIRLTVAKNRAQAAWGAGLGRGNSFLNNWRTGNASFDFPGTTALIDRALYWESTRSIGRALVAGLQAVERLSNVMGAAM